MMLLLHPRKRFDGEVFLAFLGLYAALRFALEFIRADDRGGMLGLSTSQLIGIVVVAASAYFWIRLRKRAQEAPPPASPPSETAGGGGATEPAS
jgi:phosphatidylglycerol:prolipoprotein diacylglycerol transferase